MTMRRNLPFYLSFTSCCALLAAAFHFTPVSAQEVLPAFVLDPVEVHGRSLTEKEKNDFYRMVYNVRRTYPYAVLAKERMDRYNAMRQEVAKKKDQRRFLKEEEAAIKRDFLEDLKNLTKSQGAILIKLLARQTDTTAYFLLKDFRGGARATAYQTIARLWGYNLKETYQPQERDRDIEAIVQMIESGRLSTIAPKQSPALQSKKEKEKQRSKN